MGSKSVPFIQPSPGPSDAVLEAMTELWKLSPACPDNMRLVPAFLRLCEACRDNYPNIGKGELACFALSTALEAIGLPCNLIADTAYSASTSDEASKQLDAALRASHAKHLYLAPLDLAAGIPPVAFGSARLGRFTPDELLAMVGATRLKRMLPHAVFDADRFSEFYWLVVEENLQIDTDPRKRNLPAFFMDLSQDFGRIEPHKRRFPGAVEDALFFLLLAPWEAWSTMPEVDWRGFRIPWYYTVNSDIFVRPSAPPSPDTLNWHPQLFRNQDGEDCEIEVPLELPLRDEARTELGGCNQHFWAVVEEAKKSVLFETPIAHFLVRAFLSEGVDEFLAHITTIEAALGLQADYQKKYRITPNRHKNLNSTNRMAKRVAGLLKGRNHADDYKKLFDLRSAFLHGRNMPAISTKERFLARSLARQVVCALVHATRNGSIASREDFLDQLLDQGTAII